MNKPNSATLVDRLRGIYPSAVDAYKPSPINVEAADEIERLRMQLSQTRAASDDLFQVGDWVEKFTGDYKLTGVIVGHAITTAGQIRYVVEHQPLAPGMLHIYSAKNIRLIGQ